MKIRILKRIALVISLVFLLLCGATLALMFQKTEPIQNKFEPAYVDCLVHETTNSNTTTDVDTKSSITVENTGNIHAYLRVRLVSYWVDKDGNIGPIPSEMPAIAINDANWIAGSGYTYYHKTEVASLHNSQELLKNPISLGTKTVSGTTYYQVVEVFAEAIQSKPPKAVTDSWKVTVNDDGVITAAN